MRFVRDISDSSFHAMLPRLLAVSAILSCLLISRCGAGSRQSGKVPLHPSRNELQRGLDGEPATLDPSQATDSFSFEVLRDVYEGLTSESATGKIIPGVAESWTVDTAGTKYTFRFRPDARWSNGLRVKPQDFVDAWRRVVNPRNASPVADALRPIVGAPEIIAGRLPFKNLGVRAIGKYTLEVTLSEPCPYFLQLLTHTALFPVFSDAAAKSHSASTWVSDGPYALVNWIPGEKIALRRNIYYWNSAGVQIQNVIYDFTPDENTALREYLAGQLDITDSVPTNAFSWIKRTRPSELHVWPFLGVAYYAINLRDPKIHFSLKLRQALAMAINRKLLTSRILQFGQAPAYGFVPNGTWDYTSQSWPWKEMTREQRVAEAQKLYRDAGYSQKHPLHIRLLINANSTIKDTAVATAAMWKHTLGIRTTIVEQEYRVFLQSRKDPSQWDIARLGWTADYDDATDFLDLFRRNSPNNDAGYFNDKFATLMNRASDTMNSTLRRQLLENAESLMLSEYPVIPIYFYVSDRLVKPYIGGVNATIMNRLYSKYLYFQ